MTSAKPTSRTVTARHRWGVASRVLAACLGGYMVAALLSAVLALALPWVSSASKAEGVLIGSLLSFAVYTGVVLWVFSVRSATRAWAGLCFTALVAGVMLAMLRAAAA